MIQVEISDAANVSLKVKANFDIRLPENGNKMQQKSLLFVAEKTKHGTSQWKPLYGTNCNLE